MTSIAVPKSISRVALAHFLLLNFLVTSQSSLISGTSGKNNKKKPIWNYSHSIMKSFLKKWSFFSFLFFNLRKENFILRVHLGSDKNFQLIWFYSFFFILFIGFITIFGTIQLTFNFFFFFPKISKKNF